MSTLTPIQAAEIARGVYGLLNDSIAESRARGRTLGCEGLFKVEDGSRFVGKSGALFWKALSGFGYIAEGEGQYQGDVLLVTRGTAMGADWLTNLNMAMQIGPGGHPVHAGFNQTWKSISADIQSFLRGRNPSCIHCVGHSLGGALATLNADYLSSSGVAQVKLYTFGAPRAGTLTFSRALTQRVGSRNIYRVSHSADPVPMIPIFPFLHAPHDREGYSISSAGSGLISVNAHLMLPSYIPGVAGSDWSNLGRASTTSWDTQIKAWLEQPAAGPIQTAVMGSAKLLWMITKALAWILARVKDLLVGAIGTTLAVGATLLDQLAWLLARGAKLSVEVGVWVTSLVRAIFRFLGRTLQAGVSLTLHFLRWCLELLYESMRSPAVRALSMIR